MVENYYKCNEAGLRADAILPFGVAEPTPERGLKFFSTNLKPHSQIKAIKSIEHLSTTPLLKRCTTVFFVWLDALEVLPLPVIPAGLFLH
jgi:hypothetical protein